MGFCLLLKIWTKILVKILGENMCSKYSQQLLHLAKQSVADPLKAASKKSSLKHGRSSWWFDWQ